jgi:hypothetical protein
MAGLGTWLVLEKVGHVANASARDGFDPSDRWRRPDVFCFDAKFDT